MKTVTRFLAAAACVAGLGGAIAQTSHSHGSATQPVPMDAAATQKMMTDMTTPGQNDTASTRDFKAGHKTMMTHMHVAYTGDPDVDFRKQMIPHHQGAIDMAEVALKHAKDPSTKKMAQEIIDAQKREIAEMQAWLKQKGQ